MKITSLQLTIQQSTDEQGYGDNFYITIDDKGSTTISRPYKSIPIEEQLAIEEVIISAIKAHIKLVKQVDNANKDLKLEEYRPVETLPETTYQTVSVETLELAQAELAGRPEGSNAQTESYVIVGEDAYKASEKDLAEETLEKKSRSVTITKVTEEDIFGE